MSGHGSHFITRTLQANWNQAISDIISCFNANLIQEAWLATDTLYRILPPEIYESNKGKVVEEHDRIKKTLDSFIPESVSYVDQAGAVDQTIEYLQSELKPFFRLMYQALFDGGYLDARFGPRHADQPGQSLGKRPDNRGIKDGNH